MQLILTVTPADAQPNEESSDFFITVEKPNLVAALKPMEWESYYFG